MIDDVFAGEPGDDVRARAEPAAGPCPHLGLVTADPEQLGADRLGAELAAGPVEDGVRAEPLGELLDLGRGPAVDAVEDARPERGEVVVGDQDARTDPADAEPGDRVAAGVQRQLPADRDDLAPPDGLGVHLGVAGVGQGHLVAPHRLGDHDALGGGQHALAASGADIDPHDQGSHKPSQSRRTAVSDSLDGVIGRS